MTSLTEDSLLTSHQVGSLLQVNRRSINNWIEQGRIPAFRTPGGHRRVRVADLLSFLDGTAMPVPKSLARVRRRRVMLVDDDARQLGAIVRLLEAHAREIEVRTFECGVDALLELGRFQPHAIVIDLFMPHLDGFEVCRRIKARPEDAHIELIACSGQLTPAVNQAAFEAGADRCLPKPLSSKTLLSALRLGDADAYDIEVGAR